jgi:hypothetical protein
MSQGVVIAEVGHIVNVIPPVDVTGGATGDRFSMARWTHASIIIQIGVSAAAFTKIILRECDAASGGTATDIAYKLYSEETAAGDTLGAKESVAATGKTPSANNSIMYVIELDARSLSDGFPWVEVALTNGSNSVIASCVAILSGGRYANAESETVIA